MVNWTQLLKSEMEKTYSATEKLLDHVDPISLGWKPESGSNWMTVGQLLKHITNACGFGCKGFVTGNWGLPEGISMKDLPPEEMVPPAEKWPAVESVEEARKLLAEDHAMALQALDQAGENEIANKELEAPWAPGAPAILGVHLLMMIQHLNQHKGQLFYYLKLHGKPVNTKDLWG